MANTTQKREITIKPKSTGIGFGKKAQAAGATGGIILIAGSEIGRALGCISSDKAKKMDQIGLVVLSVSTAPKVYEKIENTDFLGNFADQLLNTATKALGSL